ncbi:sulfatase family protein [Petrachloros mirabilis]
MFQFQKTVLMFLAGNCLSLLPLLYSGWSSVTNAAEDARPNVVFVLADDIGPGDIEVFQERFSKRDALISTPTLNGLIQDGLTFENARTPAALCAPTRWAVMTGNYNYRSHKPWGIWGAFEPNRIPAEQMTLGRVMQRAGYTTAFFGKWGFGLQWNAEGSNEIYTGNEYGKGAVDLTRVVRGGPSDLGFNYSVALPAGIQNVPYAFYENEKWMPLSNDSVITNLTWRGVPKGSQLGKQPGRGDSAWDSRRVGPILAQKAVDFITRRSDYRPFFIYYCSQAVHHPHTPHDQLDGKPVAGTTPSKHLDMVNEFDIQLGMLIRALKARGVYENTLIVVTSDNGGMAGNNGVKETISAGHDSTAGLREDKGSIYEGGSRVPFIAIWPGKIRPGTVSTQPVMAQDMLATLAALTGRKLGETDAMDSLNLLPLMTGVPGAKGHDVMVTQGRGKHGVCTAIIENDWKLIIQTNQRNGQIRKPIALFNLKENPLEEESGNRINAPEQAARVKHLMKLNDQLRDEKQRTTLTL